MPSLVQAHQMRIAAARAETDAAQTHNARAMRWLHDQRSILAGIQSDQQKEAHKAQVLPEIRPYLDGVLQANTGAADVIVSHCAVWAIDAGDWPLAMDLAAYVVRHGLAMPDQFKRNAPTTITDLMADAALAGRMPADVAPQLLATVLDITEGANMPDQSRAKAHKAIAYGMANKTMRAGDAGDWAGLSPATLRMALAHLQQAEQLDDKCGVKKDITAVQRELAKHEPAAAPAPSPAPAQAAKAPATKKPTRKPKA